MKIALLARNPHLYSHRRICEAARARGHEIEVINTLRVSINITSRRPTLYYHKRRLEDFDAVIPRIGASVTFYGLAVLRQFEVMGVYPLNESVAIGRSRDKLRCLQLLARRGIGLPVTAFTHDPKQAEDIIDLVGGVPVVINMSLTFLGVMGVPFFALARPCRHATAPVTIGDALDVPEKRSVYQVFSDAPPWASP